MYRGQVREAASLPEVRDGYAVTNGIRMYYVEAGAGPLVILCHGWPEFWYSWRHQLEPLGEAGYRAVAVDLPGYGRSDKPDVVYDVRFLTRCLAGIIEALGHERAVMAGHDWGGLLVWPFARLYPERTAGVIGVNTPDFPRPPAPPVEIMRAVNPDLYIVQFQDRGAAEFFCELDVGTFIRLVFLGPPTVNRDAFPDEVLERYAEVFRARGAMTPPLEYYRNMDRNWELTSGIADVKVEVPALMICAENDPVLTPAMTEGMEERVPDLEKVVIPNCGHWTQQERPEETTAAMLGFLSRLDPWP